MNLMNGTLTIKKSAAFAVCALLVAVSSLCAYVTGSRNKPYAAHEVSLDSRLKDMPDAAAKGAIAVFDSIAAAEKEAEKRGYR